jgi:uncharacterized protein YndB with AHSA1/START domain
MNEDTTMTIERVFDARPEAVFRAWTTREAMEQWYRDGDGFVAHVTELDVRVGGRYRVEFGPAGQDPYVEHGEYLEIDPPHRLVMTETLDGVETPWADTRVTVELREAGGKTRLTLTHSGFPSPAHRDLATGGWPGFLDRIESLLG